MAVTSAGADIVLLNPKFELSFWGMERSLFLIRKKANTPTAALPLLAALTPPEHRITLIDEAVEPIDYERCARADIVGLTGMMPQRRRMREILKKLRQAGVRHIVVGGPWVTVKEGDFDGLADTIFIGEAEETWPQFLADWARGEPKARYEQAGKTDMSQVPAPRFDLLKMDSYTFGSLQLSRGCPFQCEFCDIIVVFGRRPRIKTADQVIAELEGLRRHNMRQAFIVDDNLIGNKGAIKPILRRIIAWQEQHGYPITFMAEASLDLADDPELIALMAEANISSVFIGLESTNEASLIETRKLQNVRPGGTMLEKVHRIQDAGIEVTSGMIAGFDSDEEGVFDDQQAFLAKSRIALSMMGMLVAIPKTPLYERLEASGRLDLTDPPKHGTNVLPLKMTRERLSAGYVSVVNRLYEPDAYFDRLDDLYLRGRALLHRGWFAYAARHPWRRRARHLRFWVDSLGMMLSLSLLVRDPALRSVYYRRIVRYLRTRPSAPMLRYYLFKCTAHYHFQHVARSMTSGGIVNSF